MMSDPGIADEGDESELPAVAVVLWTSPRRGWGCGCGSPRIVEVLEITSDTPIAVMVWSTRSPPEQRFEEH